MTAMKIFRTNPYRLSVYHHHRQAMMKTLYYALLAGMALGSIIAILIEEKI